MSCRSLNVRNNSLKRKTTFVAKISRFPIKDFIELKPKILSLATKYGPTGPPWVCHLGGLVIRWVCRGASLSWRWLVMGRFALGFVEKRSVPFILDLEFKSLGEMLIYSMYYCLKYNNNK